MYCRISCRPFENSWCCSGSFFWFGNVRGLEALCSSYLCVLIAFFDSYSSLISYPLHPSPKMSFYSRWFYGQYWTAVLCFVPPCFGLNPRCTLFVQFKTSMESQWFNDHLTVSCFVSLSELYTDLNLRRGKCYWLLLGQFWSRILLRWDTLRTNVFAMWF